MKGVSSPSASSTLVLMDRCGVGFWTGDPNIFPTGEGQLGPTSTLGPETPASLGREPVWMQMGGGGGRAFPSPNLPMLSQPSHLRTTMGTQKKPDAGCTQNQSHQPYVF